MTRKVDRYSFLRRSLPPVINVILDPEVPDTVIIESDKGYFMTTRRGKASVHELSEQFGDKIFDPAPDRHANGGGSNRG